MTYYPAFVIDLVATNICRIHVDVNYVEWVFYGDALQNIRCKLMCYKELKVQLLQEGVLKFPFSLTVNTSFDNKYHLPKKPFIVFDTAPIQAYSRGR